MSQSTGRSQQAFTDRYPLVEGGIAGALAFIVGVVGTVVLVALDDGLSDDLDAVSEFDGIDTLDVVLWAFFEAHFAAIEASGELPLFGHQEGSVDVLSEASLPELLFTAVPVVVLLVAGFSVVQRTRADSGTDAAVAGATLVIGYLPLTLAGIFLSEGTIDVLVTEVTVQPDPITTLLLAGLLFPLALGALGGALAFSLQSSRSDSDRRR